MPQANGESLIGQILYGIRRLPIPFVKRMVNDPEVISEMMGDANTEITPNDRGSWDTRVYDTAAIATILEAMFTRIEAYENIQGLPAVLDLFEVIYETGGGDGENNEVIDPIDLIAPGSLSISAGGSAEASAYCIPKLKYRVKQYRDVKRRVHYCYFYLANVTIANVLTKLSSPSGLNATVLDWPKFQEDSPCFVLAGERVSVSAKANYQAQLSTGSGSTLLISKGDGENRNVSPTIEIVNLPLCIHAELTFDAAETETHTATGFYNAVAGPLANTETIEVDAVANGSVAASGTAASTPNSTIPASGYYLYRLDPQPEDVFGLNLVVATVFSFGDL